VSLLASIPSVTCSAVEADPNPLGPAHPVTREKIPIFFVKLVLGWLRSLLAGEGGENERERRDVKAEKELFWLRSGPCGCSLVVGIKRERRSFKRYNFRHIS
jgi:hypothetical protein